MVFLKEIFQTFSYIGLSPFNEHMVSYYWLKKWIVICIILCNLIPQIHFSAINISDDKAIRSINLTIHNISCLAKVLAYIKCQSKIKQLYLSMTHFVAQRNSTGAFAFFIATEKCLKKLFLIYFCVGGAGPVLYGLVPALFQFYLFWTNQATNDSYVTPFDTLYFFDSSKSGIYQTFYLISFVSHFMSVVVVIAADFLFVGFCFYISSMYQSLSYNLVELNQLYTSGICTSSGEDADHFKLQLKELLQDHIQILKITSMMNEIYSPLMLIQFLTSLNMITCILLLQTNSYLAFDIDIGIFLFYLSVVLFQLYMYCYCVSLLASSSEKFAANVYDTNWYEYPMWARKCILTLLTLAQTDHSIKILSNLGCDLKAFCKILQLVNSLYLILRSFKTY